MTAGRPTKYKKKYCKMLTEHMSEGLSVESFGGVIGVCKDTIYQWIKKHKEFSDAKKEGEVASMLFWERIGVTHIVNKTDSVTYPDKSSESKSRSLNSAVWCFNMKNRFGWRDKKEIEFEGDVDINLNYNLEKEPE